MVLKLLLAKGARVDEIIPPPKPALKRNKIALVIGAAHFGNAQAVLLLLARGADLNKPNATGMTPLTHAVRVRQPASLTFFSLQGQI